MAKAATSQEKLMSEIEDSFLLCKICFEIYKKPKTLVCLHVFCEGCIEKTADAEFERSYRYMLYSRSVTCPICRKKTELPGGGVRRLPDNFLVANLTDVLNRKKPSGAQPLCEICKPNGNGRSNIAISKCLDCSKVLCKSCVDLHRRTKVTSSHGLYDIEVEKNIECKIHPDEVVRFYCEPCEQCICVVCTFQEHKGHDVSSFTDGMQKHAHSLDAILSTCKERMTHLREQIHLISSCENEIKTTEEHIHDVAIDTISAVRRKEKEMVDKLSEVFGRDSLDFFKTKEDLQDMMENIQATCSLTEIILKDKSIELLLLRKEIQHKLEGLIAPPLEPPPVHLPQQVKFVPGSLTFGYLDVDGKGIPDEFKDSDFSFNHVESTGMETEKSEMKESGTAMDHSNDESADANAKAASSSQGDNKSESSMVVPNMRDSGTMTPTTPTMRRKVQTEQVVQTTQSTATVQADTNHQSTNTLAASTSERSTLTKRLSYIDEITDTGGLVLKRDQETLTPLKPIRSAGTLTELVVLSNKGTSTLTPDLRNKMTATPRLAQTTRETMTPFIAMLDMGVTAKIPGIDKASATKTTITSDSYVMGGDVRTCDIGLDSPFDPVLKMTLEKGTMYDVKTKEIGMKTDSCTMSDMNTYTNFFQMNDKSMETESVQVHEASASTVNATLVSVGVETTKRKMHDKGVHVQEKVAKLETKSCPTQTSICLHHYIPEPNIKPCNQSTNTPAKELTSRETSTLQVKLKDCGTGSFNVKICDTGIGDGNVYTSSMGVNTLKTPTISKGISTSKTPSSTKGTTTILVKTSETAMVTDQVQTKDGSHDAYRGLMCDADSNTDRDIVVKSACKMSDMATSPDVRPCVEKGVGTIIKVNSQSTATTIDTQATSTNTEFKQIKDFGTSMSSNVNTSEMDTCTLQLATKDATSETIAVETVSESTGTEKTLLKDSSTGTIQVATKTRGVGSQQIKTAESSTFMPQPIYKNTGINPEPKVMLEKLTNTATIDLEDRGTGPEEKYTFTKGTETDRVETRSIKTITRIPVVEKATYMPQLVTMSTGTSVSVDTSEKIVGTIDKITHDSGTMTQVKKFTDQDTSMGRGVKAKNSGTVTTRIELTDAASDAVAMETSVTSTNTPIKVFIDVETATNCPVTLTKGTTTSHNVQTIDQSEGTPTLSLEDRGTDSGVQPSMDSSTMTKIDTRTVGVLKRPHTLSRGSETMKARTTSTSTGVDTPLTKDGQVMTEKVITSDKGITSKPANLVTRSTGTVQKKVKEMSTSMIQTETKESFTSPIPPNSVDRQCSPMRTELFDRQSSPIPIPKANKKVGAKCSYSTKECSTSTISVTTKDSFTSEPLVAMRNSQCSPIPQENIKTVNTGTSPITVPLTDRESSPFKMQTKDGFTSTVCVKTTERGSNPVRIPTRSCGVHVGVMMETKGSGTPKIYTSESSTEMPQINHANTGTATHNIYVAEKQTSTAQIQHLHKNVSTDNVHTLDASTSTPIDIVASYLGAIKPEKAVTVTRGTATDAVTMENKEMSPIRALSTDKASSPVRIITFDKAVGVSGKGEITAPVDKFQKAGALGKSRPNKPIADSTKLARLDSITEDAENRSSGSEDENIIGGFGSLPALPTFPRHKLRPRPNLFTDTRPQLFNQGPRHTEKFWPSSPRLGINKGLQQRSSSMFNVGTGNGSPSSILMKVEMGTNTSDRFTEDRGTSTPPIDKQDKAICTESLNVNVDGRMAECISKLKTVRQRLEQSPTYTSPCSSPSPRMLSPPVHPTVREPPLLQTRSKSVDDGLDEADDYSPFVSPMPLRKANAVLDSLSESSDSDKVSTATSCPPPPQSPKTRQALARKQRLDLSQMLRSASMPESEHPPFSPMPRPKFHKPKVIPPLEMGGLKTKGPRDKSPVKKPKPKRATRTMTKFSLAPQIEEEQGQPGDFAAARSRKETQKEKLQSQLQSEERRAITRTLLHPMVDSGSSSRSDSSGNRSPSSTFRNPRPQTPRSKLTMTRDAKTSTSLFRTPRDEKK